MKRFLSVILILVLLLSCAALCTGCGEEEEQEYPVTVNGVTIESEPKQIVVLDDNAADIIAYIGYDGKMVGRSMRCDQEFLSFFPTVDGSGKSLADSITGIGADLVIVGSEDLESTRSALAGTEIRVIAFDLPKDFASLKELYNNIATVLGGGVTGPQKGEKAYNLLVNSLKRYQSIPEGVIKTSVYLYLNERGELCTFTKGSLEQKIFDYNGTMNALANQEEPQVVASELRMGSPNYIFYDDDAVLEYLRSDDTLKNLPALLRNSMCRIPMKGFFRYGTTCEQVMYDMTSFISDSEKPAATPDEATPDETGNDPDDDQDDSGDYDDGEDDGSDYDDGDYESYDDYEE